MQTFEGKLVVITGAASGIGRALAVAFAAAGADLALADRDVAGLAETVRLAGERSRITTHELDVADEAAMRAFAAAVEREHGRADVLINNAGVALYGSVMELSSEEFAWLMGINFWGVVYGVQAFLPMLLARPEAVIVNLSSLFGLFGPPGQSAYVASKFAVRGFSESLRAELASTGVHVVSVHPAGVATAIARKTRIALAADRESAEKDSRKFDRHFLTMPPDRAAAIIIAGIKRKRDRVLVGKDAIYVDWLNRLLGGRAGRVFTKRIKFDPARNRRG